MTIISTTDADHTDPDLVSEMEDIVAETLDGLLGSGAISLPLPDVAGHADTVIESIVPIDGDGVDARLVVRVPAATAIALTAALTDDPVDTIDLNEAGGTMSELCNVIGGSAKTLFDIETALGIPGSRTLRTADLDDLSMIVCDHQVAQFEVCLLGG